VSARTRTCPARCTTWPARSCAKPREGGQAAAAASGPPAAALAPSIRRAGGRRRGPRPVAAGLPGPAVRHRPNHSRSCRSTRERSGR
jgi:hypothetical protein